MISAQVAFGTKIPTPRMSNNGSYKSVNKSQQKELRQLSGHMLRGTDAFKKIGAMEGNRILDIAVALPWRNQEVLDQLIYDITNPNSEKFQQYLLAGEFVDQFSPNDTEVDKTTSYLKKHGLTVKSVAANRLLIHAQGPVKNINAMFHTEINYYQDKNGKQFFAPAYELQVDKSLNITGVVGLENRFKPQRAGKIEPLKTPSQTKTDIDSNELSVCASPAPGLTPSDIQMAYSLSPLPNRGAGQTIALYEQNTYEQTDIDCYNSNFSITPGGTKTNIFVGWSGTGENNTDNPEPTVDIEMLYALAPDANIRVYIGDPQCNQIGHLSCFAVLLDTYNQMAIDHSSFPINVISTSYGLAETLIASQQVLLEYQIFQQMATQGQTIFAASGDDGSYDDKVTLSVDDPASQPLVVGVGGTSLFLNGDGIYNHETGWSNDMNPLRSSVVVVGLASFLAFLIGKKNRFCRPRFVEEPTLLTVN